MSEPEPSEHDPHFLAQVNERLDAILREQEAPHWFAVTPCPVPTPSGHPALGFMLCIWRQHANGVSTINAMDAFLDFQNFLDDEGTLERYADKVLGELRDAYFGGTAALQQKPSQRLIVPGR